MLMLYSSGNYGIIFAGFDEMHGLWIHGGLIPNSLRPKFKFKSQSQMNIWDLDIKA